MAMSSCGEVQNSNMMQVFDERVKRIVEECFEVALILCNKEMDEFNASKIFDIFAQIFTTASVLNTGYWPFFTAVNGQCLCVCGRFGIPCRHIKNDSHWIDMQPIAHDIGSAVFYPKRYGPISLQDYEIFIKPLDGNGHYNIGIILSIQYKKNERGRPRREKNTKDKLQKDDNKKPYPVSIFSRFYTMNQYYAPFFTLMFNPNPFFNDLYGTIFKNLLQLRSQQFPSSYREHRQTWCIANSQMPSFTFIPYYVNLPVFKFPAQLHAFIQPPQKCKQMIMVHKSVQTNEQNVPEAAGNDFMQKYSTHESQYASLQLSSATLTSVNTQPQETVDSEQYKNPLPLSSHTMVNQLLKYTNTISIDKIDQTSQKTAAINSMPDAGEPSVNSKQDYSYLGLPSLSSNLNISNTPQNTQNQQKNKIDEYWYTNFPALKTLPPTFMTKSEIDEEFELIESVITKDILEDDGNLDWWNNNKQ